MSLSGKTCTLQHTLTQNRSSRLSICSQEPSRSSRSLSREELVRLTSRERQLSSRQLNNSESRQSSSSTERSRPLLQEPIQSPESTEPRSRPSEPEQRSSQQPNREQEYMRTYNSLPLQTRAGAGERAGMQRPPIEEVVHPLLTRTLRSPFRSDDT